MNFSEPTNNRCVNAQSVWHLVIELTWVAMVGFRHECNHCRFDDWLWSLCKVEWIAFHFWQNQNHDEIGGQSTVQCVIMSFSRTKNKMMDWQINKLCRRMCGFPQGGSVGVKFCEKCWIVQTAQDFALKNWIPHCIDNDHKWQIDCLCNWSHLLSVG